MSTVLFPVTLNFLYDVTHYAGLMGARRGRLRKYWNKYILIQYRTMWGSGRKECHPKLVKALVTGKLWSCKKRDPRSRNDLGFHILKWDPRSRNDLGFRITERDLRSRKDLRLRTTKGNPRSRNDLGFHITKGIPGPEGGVNGVERGRL